MSERPAISDDGVKWHLYALSLEQQLAAVKAEAVDYALKFGKALGQLDAVTATLTAQAGDIAMLREVLEEAARELDGPASQCRYCSGTVFRSAHNPERGYKPRFVGSDGKRTAVPFPHTAGCVLSVVSAAIARLRTEPKGEAGA